MPCQPGGQGLHLVVVFQDLSQVAARWGHHIAAGILTLCSSKLVLGGIADPGTLSALSQFIGQYDRILTSTTTGYSTPANFLHGGSQATRSTSTSIQRQPVMEPGQIAQIPPGQALYINGTRYSTITLGPWWDPSSPWDAITRATVTAAAPIPGPAGPAALPR